MARWALYSGRNAAEEHAAGGLPVASQKVIFVCTGRDCRELAPGNNVGRHRPPGIKVKTIIYTTPTKGTSLTT
jgi:hypothetical protein